MQASRFDVAPNQIVEPRFVDRNLARQQTPDLLLVDIDAGHVDAHFGKAGARHQSDVASFPQLKYSCAFVLDFSRQTERHSILRIRSAASDEDKPLTKIRISECNVKFI